jgi:hypothetical protein
MAHSCERLIDRERCSIHDVEHFLSFMRRGCHPWVSPEEDADEKVRKLPVVQLLVLDALSQKITIDLSSLASTEERETIRQIEGVCRDDGHEGVVVRQTVIHPPDLEGRRHDSFFHTSKVAEKSSMFASIEVIAKESDLIREHIAEVALRITLKFNRIRIHSCSFVLVAHLGFGTIVPILQAMRQ